MDIQLYRRRIGTFIPKFRVKKSDFSNRRPSFKKKSEKSLHFQKCKKRFVKSLFLQGIEQEKYSFSLPTVKIVIYVSILMLLTSSLAKVSYDVDEFYSQKSVKSSCYLENTAQRFKVDSNFWARYTYGNKNNAAGLKCLHLNIRFLGQKVIEVKNKKNDHISLESQNVS